MFWKKFEKILVIFLLGIFLAFNLYLAATDSQTIDEGPHISAGYSYLKTGDFRMNPEHPPLVKELAGLPLLFFNLDLPTDDKSWNNYNQWDFGRQFIYHNELSPDTIIFLARLGPIILGLILGFFIYKWSKELFGLKAGLFALLLYSFSPNFIAHSHLVTTDVALSLFFVLSIYYFGKYLKNPNKRNLIVASIVFALCFNAKYSAILIIPILVIIYLLHWIIKRKETRLGFKKLIITILIFTAVTSLITFIFYGFEFKKPIEDPRVERLYEERQEIENQGTVDQQPFYVKPLISLGDPKTNTGKFLKNFAENFPVPAYSYWRGFFSVLSHNTWGHGSFLMGMTGEQGWWYYFIIAFLVKTPLSTIFLTLSGLIYLLYKISKKSNTENIGLLETLKKIKFDYWLITIPPLIYFAWSLTSHINLGVRHILPVYPFIFIGASSLINIKPGTKFKKCLFNSSLIIIIIYCLFTNFSVFPYSLSYFNEAVGSAKNGHQYLLDSNIDWGQDVKRLVKYLEEENIDQCHTYILGSLDLNYYYQGGLGMPNKEEIEKNGIPSGYYATSTGPLYDPNGDYHWLTDYPVFKRIGYSINIYKF